MRANLSLPVPPSATIPATASSASALAAPAATPYCQLQDEAIEAHVARLVGLLEQRDAHIQLLEARNSKLEAEKLSARENGADAILLNFCTPAASPRLDAAAQPVSMSPAQPLDASGIIESPQAPHISEDEIFTPKASERATKPDSIAKYFESKMSCTQFEVEMYKEGEETFGLAHIPIGDDVHIAHLLVAKIQEGGCLWRLNERTSQTGRQEETISPGDRIVSVDGLYGDLEQMRCALRNQRAKLKVERWADTFTIPVRRRFPSESLGLRTEIYEQAQGASSSEVSCGLYVVEVSGGYCGDWNRLASERRRYCDYIPAETEIIRVGKTERSPEAMREALESGDADFEIELKRLAMDMEED